VKKFFANKLIILAMASLLIIALIIFSAIPGSPLANITTPISYVVDPIQKGFQAIGTKISDFHSAIAEGMEIRQENEELKAEIAELEYEVAQGEEARLRWEELREAFSIQDSFENYHIYGASILTREADEWFSVMRVNVGTDNGIDAEANSYAVVDARMNLVGRVLETDPNSSKILPILHEGFAVSAKVNTVNGAVVRVTGDINLKNEGLCRISQIPTNVILNVGDELVTSGDGGLFPAGIPIGVIESVDYSDELNPSAVLRPYVSISDIKDVFIMVPGREDDDDEDIDNEETNPLLPDETVPSTIDPSSIIPADPTLPSGTDDVAPYSVPIDTVLPQDSSTTGSDPTISTETGGNG